MCQALPGTEDGPVSKEIGMSLSSGLIHSGGGDANSTATWTNGKVHVWRAQGRDVERTSREEAAAVRKAGGRLCGRELELRGSQGKEVCWRVAWGGVPVEVTACVKALWAGSRVPRAPG